jgi:hypothetical protein
MPRRLVLILAWLQLAASLAIAAVTVYVYSEFRPAFSDGIRSATAAVTGVSEAMERASETIEARRRLISQAAGVLAMAATQIDQVEGLASGQAKVAPQYAQGLQSASALLLDLAGTSRDIALAMDVEMPSGVTIQGTKPVYTTSRPLAGPAKKLYESAARLKDVGTALSTAASSLVSGAQILDKTISETSRQSRTLVGELEKTVNLLASKELPDALDDLKKTSASLRLLSRMIEDAQGIGAWLVFAGLLLSLWCLLNSLTTIGLAAIASPTSVLAARGALQ